MNTKEKLRELDTRIKVLSNERDYLKLQVEKLTKVTNKLIYLKGTRDALLRRM